MTKKLIAILATLPVATLGAAGFALANDTGNVVVTNVNSAVVVNEVLTFASTGGNSSDGGSGGSAGNGGSVLNSDDGNMGGNGGNGGMGGNGGTVMTGEAMAVTDILNDVNYNETDINRCECDNGDTEGDDVVTNVNGALLGNGVGTLADTGSNSTNGGSGGSAGSGGSVEESDDDNVGGNGGAGNAGGSGGSTTTGPSTAVSQLVNLINTNITRILR